MHSKDKEKTRYWALAPVGSGGALVGYSVFLLVNRVTGREHQLHIPNGGMQFSLGGSGGSPSYTSFKTRKAVSFADFDGVGARITTANFGVIYGYSVVYLTLWESSVDTSNKLAYVKMSGGSVMLPGGGISHGVTIVSYGSGSRSGTVPLVLNKTKIPTPQEPRMSKMKVSAYENPRIVPKKSKPSK